MVAILTGVRWELQWFEFAYSLVAKDVEFKNKNTWLLVPSLRTDWQSVWALTSVDLYTL